MRGRFGRDGLSAGACDTSAIAEEDGGEGVCHDCTIDWSVSTRSQDAEGWSALFAGHRGVAEESTSMGSHAADGSDDEDASCSLVWWSSRSALRLRLREWKGRASWARSSMDGREGGEGDREEGGYEPPYLGRKLANTW